MDTRSLLPFGRALGLGRDGDDPFAAMRRDMDRMLEQFGRSWGGATWGTEGFLSPKVDVAETEQGLELHAELPGVDVKDVDLNVSDGVLTLRAERRQEKEEKDEKKQYHLVERAYGTYLRRFAIPFEPDAERVEASFNNGVLTVRVPRSPKAETQVKKIAIKQA